jgi:uncharacterized protein
MAALPIRALIGLRQVGKSSFLREQCEKGRRYVTLDDPAVREVAQEDPRLFFVQHPLPLIVDECQLVPDLFPVIKLVIDEWRIANGNVGGSPLWLSGSNQLLIDKRIRESLAGRVNYFRLHSLSTREIRSSNPTIEAAEVLFRGGWPVLWNESELSPHQYYADYVRSAIEKDVVLFGHIEKSEKFLRVIRLLAGRVGNLLSIADISKDAGVSTTAVSDWLDILTSLGFVYRVAPFYSNTNKRLIKSPKIYFCDSGLAARICGWSERSPLMASPYAGALFENMVHSELVRLKDHEMLPWEIYFWRTKEQEEVDFLIDIGNGRFVAVEVKLGTAKLHQYRIPNSIDRELPGLPVVVVSLEGEPKQWSERLYSVGICHLADFIIELTTKLHSKSKKICPLR